MEGKDYTYHEPVQPPINPPYKEACEKKKNKTVDEPAGACGGTDVSWSRDSWWQVCSC